MKKENKESDFGWVIEALTYVIFGLISLGGIVGYLLGPKLLEKISTKNAYVLSILSVLFGVLFFTPSYLKMQISIVPLRLFIILGLWLFGFGIGLLIQNIRNLNPAKNESVATKDIRQHKNNRIDRAQFKKLIPLFKDKEIIPIGLGYPSLKPVYLENKLLLEHLMVSGATGQGKTTLLLVQLLHCLYHKRPAVVVDPKGDSADIEILFKMAEYLGLKDRIEVFSLANTETSSSYNPLEIGTSAQIISKLLTALDLDKVENPYYMNIATVVLKNIIEAFFITKSYFTLKDIALVLERGEHFYSLLDYLYKLPKTEDISSRITNLNTLKDFQEQDLVGLKGALTALTMTEFLDIFGSPSPNNRRSSINLVNTLQEGKIAYFQLNVNGYDSISRRLGKIVLQDLKLISSRFQSGQEKRQFDVAAVFVDEFGSFANADFMNFLKMSRSAGISLRLFFQGLEDLKAVSESFEGQTIGNSVYKIMFRAPAPRDANNLAEMAGTKVSLEHSHQTENTFLGTMKTGLGNEKESFAFKMHPNDLKELARGQAILVNKDNGEMSLFQTWDSKSAEFMDMFLEEQPPRKLTDDEIIAENMPLQKTTFTVPEVYFFEYEGFTYAFNQSQFLKAKRLQKRNIR